MFPEHQQRRSGQLPWTRCPVTRQVSMERTLSLAWQETQKPCAKLLDSRQGQRPRQITLSRSVTLSGCPPSQGSTSRVKSMTPNAGPQPSGEGPGKACHGSATDTATTAKTEPLGPPLAPKSSVFA